jgi:glyoxylate/hydroxypyruvate/2-ketogluconate reductase
MTLTSKSLLVARAIFSDALADLERTGLRVQSNQSDVLMSAEQLRSAVTDKQAIMCTVMDKIDKSVLDAAPKLEVVSNIAVGYNNVDVAECTRRGVKVTNTPGVLNEATADLTWAIMMAAARRVAEGDAYVRRGDWKKAFAIEQFIGADVYGKTLGIIGMGRIGQAIARRALGFNMRVLYNNRNRIAEADERAVNASFATQDELLAQSDFVVVMMPYSPAVHHFVNADFIAKMKPTAILVNTARGGVVDDAVLASALHEKKIAAAALDVFEGEPALNSAYLDLPNVVLTPHIGSATLSSRQAMVRTAMENCLAALRGEAPRHWVNRPGAS